jgi:phosphate transport system substrate-binding protein
VTKDILGIGYNNVNYAYDAKTLKPVKGLKVIPIDVNGNGKLDAEEKFYDTRDMLMAAIAGGKYPSPPARNLHLVSQGKPAKPEVTAFIKWIITDGQKFCAEAGYIGLPQELLKQEMAKLEK